MDCARPPGPCEKERRAVLKGPEYCPSPSKYTITPKGERWGGVYFKLLQLPLTLTRETPWNTSRLSLTFFFVFFFNPLKSTFFPSLKSRT